MTNILHWPLRLGRQLCRTAWLLVAGLAAGGVAYGADFIIPGVQGKACAGAGQTVSRGGASVFYNPANLSTVRGLQPEADLALAQVTYTYQNSDSAYKPSVLSVTTPMATMGLGWNPVPKLGLGLSLLPTGVGSTQLVNGFPTEISPETFQAQNIARTQTSLRLGLGASWQLTEQIALGGGLIYTYEKTQMHLVQSGSKATTIRADYKGSSTQLVLGARATLASDYVLGVSYRTAGVRHYSGSVSVNTASTAATAEELQTSAFAGVGYDPAQIGFGVEGRYRIFGGFIDVVREQWADGRAIYKQGLGTDTAVIDLQNTTDLTIGARLWPTPRQRLSAAVSMQGGNMGTGDLQVKGEPRPALSGVRPGQLEAVPRTGFAGGYRLALKERSYLELAVLLLKGSFSVPDGYSQPGTFTLNVVIASAGASYQF